MELAFKEFAVLARHRSWSVDFLVERFPGLIQPGGMVPDSTRSFFERVFQGQYGDVGIPYRSVLEFYQQEIGFHRMEKKAPERFCACACGKQVWDRKKWASKACRKRGQRLRS